MAKPGIQMWTLIVLFFEMYMGQVTASVVINCPIHYLASVPGILESGSKNRFCVSLSQPSSPVLVRVTLRGRDNQKTLLRKGTSNGFHKCFLFRVPSVEAEEEQLFEVSVKGNNSYSREIKRVLIKVFQPRTFIQTDKPIYNQGQTGNFELIYYDEEEEYGAMEFRVVTLGTKLEPAEGFYDTIVIKDPYNNRIAQWVNQTSEGTILQLSYLLANEALEGYYRIIVQTGKNRVFHSFKVQKYSLSKFDIVVTITKEVSVGQESFQVTACAKYHYRKPVDADVTVRVCRPLRNQNSCTASLSPNNDVSITSLCKTRQKKTCNKGCATFTFKVSSFTKPDPKPLLDMLDVSATVVDKLTCASHTQWERMRVTYLIGNLYFENVPKTYTQGTRLVGKVRAVDYLGKPVPKLLVHLFAGKKGSPCVVDILTTDYKGIASFSLDTEKFRGEVYLYASSTDNLEYPGKNIPYYDIAKFKVYESGPGPSACGFLRVLPNNTLLRCYREEEITIQFSLEHQHGSPLDIVYLVLLELIVTHALPCDATYTLMMLIWKPLANQKYVEVLSRGHIVFQGVNQLYFTNSSIQGQFFFNVRVHPEFAPSIQVVAYTVLDCERVLAHSAKFYTEDCFRNTVTPKFLPSPAVPGEDVQLCIKARPNSVCGVSLIDLNVLARADVRNLDANQIYGYLPIKRSEPLPPELVDEPDCLEVKPRSHFFAFTNQEKEDANTVFRNRGLQLLTNLAIQNPSCFKLGGKKYHQAVLSGKGRPHKPERKTLEGPQIPDPGRLPYTCYDELEPVYKLSTETWLFQLVKVGETGKSCVSFTVPDIITTWNTEVFCLSPQSFGLARPVLFSIFRPFSLDFKLPYSMIQGESLELKSIIYNYLPTSLKIKITAATSSSYTLIPLSTDQSMFCLCAGEHKIIRWTFTPTSLGDLTVSLSAEAVSSRTTCCSQEVIVPESGHSIVVTRSLKVKAIGHEIIKTYSWLLCPKGHHLSEKLDTHIPNNVIGGRLKAKVSASGDILCRSLKNLGDLLHLPYGCGEQNIAFMAIDTYILHYLQKSNKLYQETEKKGINILITGYQRQLTYREKTGAFSTFGTGEENTWLTALVMVTFYKSQSFIYVDPKIIEGARKWLECQQRNDGCFKVSGKLYNNKIRGGVSDEVTVCAYVTASLLEINTPADDPVVAKSLSCLKNYIYDYSNTYTTALLAYVFTLAQDWEARSKLLHHLDSIVIREGSFQYWCPTPKQKGSPLCVEISSYVLLARLTGSLSEEDVSCSSGIIRWLVKQQSYHGGFKSTQDTVVAIKAMALYSSKVLNREGSTSVTVTSPIDHLSFQVNQQNKLVYQELVLQDLKGKYWLKAEGTSCTAVQLKKGVLVRNVEYKNGHVFVYLQELQKDIPMFHELELIQEYEVQHLRASTVAIYDYYCPSVQGVTEYCGKNCYCTIDLHEHHHDYHHHDSHYHQSHLCPHHAPYRYHSRRRNPFRPFRWFRHGSHNNYHCRNHPKHDYNHDQNHGYSKDKRYD